MASVVGLVARWLSPEEWRLVLLGILVRATILTATTALDFVLPDYDTSKFIIPTSQAVSYVHDVPYPNKSHNSFETPVGGILQARSTPPALLQGWLVWDSVFFADIATRGYVFEQYYAFFPLLPALGSWAPRSLFAPVVLAISALASVTGVVLLFRLGRRLTGDARLAAIACLFFTFNPAAIFHAAAYTEAAFATATLAALYFLYCRGQMLPAVTAVAVSCGLRSNGVVNAGYLGHYCLSRAVAAWRSSRLKALGLALQGMLAAVVAVLPLFAFQYAAFRTFCLPFDGARHDGPEAADTPPDAPAATNSSSDFRWPRPWCTARLPYVYGFVQSLYWNVGFLRYWSLQQLPNFLLAAPVLTASVAGILEYCAANGGRVASLGLLPLDAMSGGRPPASQLRASQGRKAHGEAAAAAASRASGDAAPGCADSRAEDGANLRRRRSARPTAAMPTDGNGRDEVGAGDSGYLSPELTVFMYPWAFSVAVALTTMHVQVATRFLSSACPALYWYLAHVWLRSTAARVGQGCDSREGQNGPEGSHSSSRGCFETRGFWGETKRERGKGGGEFQGVWKGSCLSQGLKGTPSESAGEGNGGERAWGVWLWRWCLLYIAVGCVLFINFLPWT